METDTAQTSDSINEPDTDTAQLAEKIKELEEKLNISENNLSTVALALRKTEADNIVKNNIITAMASGLIPVPLFDIISLTNIHFHMIQTLAEHYEVPVDDVTRSLVTSLITGSLPVASMLGLGSLFKSVPGIGTLAGSGSVSVISGAVSYALGQVFIRHFEQGGTLKDFNPDAAVDYFNAQFKAGKEVARALFEEIKQMRHDKSATPESGGA
ncbi:MAG TPA: DUF697 domain-containing protein [Gammaproteobacteria bacterium]|nr:DUF697 domain-containing protein [Gammaproteobacteria bacterium]